MKSPEQTPIYFTETNKAPLSEPGYPDREITDLTPKNVGVMGPELTEEELASIADARECREIDEYQQEQDS